MRSVAAPGAGELSAAADAVAANLSPTPLVRGWALGEGVWLKLESQQPTGSFKVRGAIAALSALPGDEAVVTASAGNHGLGVAWAATRLGRRATVVVPETASPAKVAALGRFDIELVEHGPSYDEAEAHALELAERGMVFVSPYNDTNVIAGQAPVGAELRAQMGEESSFTVVVPIGGGGLASGIALSSGARVVAVEAEPSQPWRAALDEGEIVAVDCGPSLADGLGGNIEPGSVTFEIVRDRAAGVVMVREDEIEDAVRFTATQAGLVVEGAAAAAVAAVRTGRVERSGPLVVVVSGRNIAAAKLAALLAG